MMFPIQGLARKWDPEDMKQKMLEDVIFSIQNILFYVALMRITPFVVKNLDSL